MLRKQGRTIVLALVAALTIVSSGSAVAEHVADPSLWMPIDGSQALWFSFEVGRVDSDPVSTVNIAVTGRPINGAAFQLFRAGNWGYWGEPDPEDWFGMSSSAESGGAGWSGVLAPGAYFVRVAAGGAKEVQVGISGQVVHNINFMELDSGVSDTFFWSPDAEKPPAQRESPQVTNNRNRQSVAGEVDFHSFGDVSATSGVSNASFVQSPASSEYDFHLAESEPNSVETAALASSNRPLEMRPGEWMPVEDDQPHWFKFDVGRLEGEEAVHITINLRSAPFAGGRFHIFEAGKAPFYWDDPVAEGWVGASTVTDSNQITWAGDLPAGGYVVRVETRGARNCLLAVTGPTVVY